MTSPHASLVLPSLLVLALASRPAAASGEGNAQAPAAAATWSARASASVSAAIFRPSDSLVRELYGSNAVPVTVQFEYPVGRYLRPFVGFRWCSDQGRTIPAQSSPGALSYGLTLSTRSIRGGVMVGLPIGRSEVALGGGMSYTTYEERWTGVDVATRGDEPGFVVQGALRTVLTRRLLAMVRLEYSSIPRVQRVADPGSASVDLGGIEVGAGLGFRF